jgi:hypothetical protein
MPKTDESPLNNTSVDAKSQVNSAPAVTRTAAVYALLANLTTFEKKIFLKIADMECRGKRFTEEEWEKFHTGYKNRTTK